MFFRDFKKAFSNAIEKDDGFNPSAWMYMHTVENKDFFKNINTREYIEISY